MLFLISKAICRQIFIYNCVLRMRKHQFFLENLVKFWWVNGIFKAISEIQWTDCAAPEALEHSTLERRRRLRHRLRRCHFPYGSRHGSLSVAAQAPPPYTPSALTAL